MTHFIACELAKVYKTSQKSAANFLTVLAWGDEVELLNDHDKSIEIKLKNLVEKPDGSIVPVFTSGFIFKPKKSDTPKIIQPLAEKNVMMVSFVDVQQGDACVIETPKKKVIVIDGGESQLFARYLASRYPATSLESPQTIDCIVVSHGDADHFEGLPKILESEAHGTAKKRIFINPLRVYHNGIVKGPSKTDGKATPDLKLLGKTKKKDDEEFITGLENDLLEVDDKKLNVPFKAWKKTLKTYRDRNDTLLIDRLDNTSTGKFDFLASENISVQVLGPIISNVDGVPGLKFLREPSKSVEIDDAHLAKKGSYSASHTINGHSVILKLKYGNVNFLFSGDLNEEAENTLVAEQENGHSILRSEILKVPHHGSADFSNAFFEAVNPLVSVVSSGDESEAKEYIHPRATLMGVAGKYSRYDRPLVFVTELVAFFNVEGPAKVTKGSKSIFAFSRTAYGIVNVRTDGNKLFIFTHTGKRDLKEAYTFLIAADGTPTRKDVVMF
jgi:beta-lactamase superfamily II metal-dependent hydrolase